MKSLECKLFLSDDVIKRIESHRKYLVEDCIDDGLKQLIMNADIGYIISDMIAKNISFH